MAKPSAKDINPCVRVYCFADCRAKSGYKDGEKNCYLKKKKKKKILIHDEKS